MNKLHTAIVAALLALAVVLGGVAVVQTSGLGAAAQHANDAAVAAKARQLAAYERGLQHALRAKTPALPRVPAGAAGGQATQQRVVYHRPPPIVVVKHTHRGDDGSEGAGRDD